MNKELLKKYIIIFIPKLLISILAVFGVMHFWYSINYCDISYIDEYNFVKCENVTYNKTFTANYNELSYFFNVSNGKIIIPNDVDIKCYQSFKDKRTNKHY